MNRTIATLAAGLLGAGLFLGACGGEREGEQREGQRTTAEVTMATLAGEWGFDTEELRESIRRAVEADYRVPGMPAGQTPELEPGDIEMIGQMTDELATIRLTLQADGSMTIAGESMTGDGESDQGVWELRNRNIRIAIDDEGETVRGRVIDTDTIELDLEDLADFEIKVMLRKQS
ncbi:MAG: hypothetical protein JJU33_03910 [Phycisphaerales bacterium]|nr:hypothetical protein [Phycisphaerales bacterium]